MSTHSTIAIQNEDGSVTSIYCHFDGYALGGVGETLDAHFKDAQKIKKLVALGDLSSMAGCADLKDVVAFCRDRGEPMNKQIFTGLSHYKSELDAQEYNYIFRSGKWFLWSGNPRLRGLTKFLQRERKEDVQQSVAIVPQNS